MNRVILWSTVSIGLLAAVNSASAIDEVIRKSGETSAKGDITEINKDGVTVTMKVGNKTTVVPSNDIAKIRWDGEPAKLNLARGNEDGGRLEIALTGYQEAERDPRANKENIKKDIQYMIARTMGKMALAQPSKADDAISKLEAFSKANPDHFYFYECKLLLGRVYQAKKDFGNAQGAFDALKRAKYPDYRMAATAMSGRLKLDQDDVDGALSAFESVIGENASSPAEKSRRYQAMLGKATCQFKKNQYGDAIKTLDDVVKQASAEDTGVQAEAYVRQGDCLQAQNKTKEAILAYLHVPVLFSKEKALHAESLFRLSQLWGSVQKPERAADARAELERLYPDSEWAKKLAG